VFVYETRTQIAVLLDAGLSLNEIARRLGVAGPTVGYHVARVRSAGETDREARLALPPPPAARRQIATRELVADALADGLSRSEIARRLGLSKATVSYHARRVGAPVDARCARRYDWEAIQGYYDLGHSVRDCQAQFGFSRQTWHAAVKRGVIAARPAALPMDELLVAGTYRSRHNLKLRLLKEGLKAERCEECGLAEWRNRPTSFAPHHLNGDRHDNRLRNLRLLCPNCHSQTDTFSGRNGRRQAA
jgi:DNA-binding CsgD family transcriptional regulator